MLPTIHGGSTTRDVIRLLGAELHERLYLPTVPVCRESLSTEELVQTPECYVQYT